MRIGSATNVVDLQDPASATQEKIQVSLLKKMLEVEKENEQALMQIATGKGMNLDLRV